MTPPNKPRGSPPRHKAGRGGRRVVPDPSPWDELGSGWLLALLAAGLLLVSLVIALTGGP